MVKLSSSNKSVTVNYQPLRASISMDVVTSVPDRQIYSAYHRRYTPDYTLAPLTLMPHCSAIDAGKHMMAGEHPRYVNSKLTNVRWFERIGGVRKEISSGNDYQITKTGELNGQIIVKKNSSLSNPTTLEFSADFVDDRTGQVLKFSASKVIIVSDDTEAMPILEVDAPNTVLWNPLKHQNIRRLTATLRIGKDDVTADARVKFLWYRQSETGSVTLLTGTAEDEWEVESVSKNIIELNQDFMGEGNTYVCRAMYRDNGTFPKDPAAYDPEKSITFKRYIPKLECTYSGVPTEVPDGTRNIYPVAIVCDSEGVLENVDEWIQYNWLVKLPGDSAPKKVAEGKSPIIPFTKGMQLTLEIEDRGPQMLVVDDANPAIIISDTDGSVLYTRDL